MRMLIGGKLYQSGKVSMLETGLNNYHPKIKLTIEVSPKKFLDTSLDLNNGIYNFKVHRKTTKQPTHWSSKIPKRYKRNMILGDLHRSFRISSDFNEEIKLISHK